MRINIDYDIYYKEMDVIITENEGQFQKDNIFVQHEVEHSVFIQLKKALESKVGSILNSKSRYDFIRYICKIQLQSEKLDYDLNITYCYMNDRYEIKEGYPIIIKCMTKNKEYEIKDNKCNCMSFKIGNSKFGKDTCKHLEFLKHSPYRDKGCK